MVLYHNIKMSKLSELEKSFVREYLKDENGKQAYLRCKPNVTDRTAETQAHRLSRKREVQEALQEGKKELAERSLMTRERLVKMSLDVYDMAIEEKQGGAANQSVANIAKMCGLNEPEVKQLHVVDSVLKKLSHNSIDEEIND